MIRFVFFAFILRVHEISTWTSESCIGGCKSDPTGMYSASSQKELEILTRSKRNSSVEPELPLYGNPCNYWKNNRPIKTDETSITLSEYAYDVSQAISSAVQKLEELRNRFSKTLANITYERLEEKLINQNFLRAMPWYITEVLPANKKTFADLPESYMDELMTRLDKVLPKIHKGGKMLLASLRIVAHYAVCFDIIAKDKQLRPDLDKATNLFRRALCKFSDYMWKRGINSMHMYSFEEPNLTGNNTFLIYRDTMNYLQYLGQIFNRLVKE